MDEALWRLGDQAMGVLRMRGMIDGWSDGESSQQTLFAFLHTGSNISGFKSSGVSVKILICTASSWTPFLHRLFQMYRR